MYRVRFMTLEGKYQTDRLETFSSVYDATSAVLAQVSAKGFSNVKMIEEPEEDGGCRYTATTPNGRHGRNVAYLEPMFE